MVYANHPESAEQHCRLWGSEAHQLRSIEHQLLWAHHVVLFQPVTEGIVDWLERSKRCNIRLLSGGVTATGSEREIKRHTSRLCRAFYPDVSGEDDRVGNTRAELLGNRLKDGEHLVESLWLIPLPGSLRGQADARPVRSPAHVGTSIGARRIPRCCNKLLRGEP